MGIKTVVISILILIVLQYIIQFLKDSFTQPIVKYIQTDKNIEIDRKSEFHETQLHDLESETVMKDELNDFLSSINI
jgi:hypothetical protein